MRFVFLGPVFCLQLPSDSASPRTPLLLANLYFCLRGSGLTPYSSCTCRAHQEETRPPKPGFSSECVTKGERGFSRDVSLQDVCELLRLTFIMIMIINIDVNTFYKKIFQNKISFNRKNHNAKLWLPSS